jgi:prevent-host-death family protein
MSPVEVAVTPAGRGPAIATAMCYKQHMASIGIRELRQRASELLRRVERGETLEVTDRGRPVAVIAPPPEGSALDRMRALGEIDPASRDLDDLPGPLVLPPGVERPSETLRRLRRDER